MCCWSIEKMGTGHMENRLKKIAGCIGDSKSNDTCKKYYDSFVLIVV